MGETRRSRLRDIEWPVFVDPVFSSANWGHVTFIMRIPLASGNLEHRMLIAATLLNNTPTSGCA